jgi:flavin-dependent dehydrogenase
MYDAAIVGAGVAGGSIACVLAEMGWDVILLERQSAPGHKVCGEFLSPEAMGTLAAMGLAGVVLSLNPSRIDSVLLTSSEGSALDIPLPGTALGVSRIRLDGALLAAAREKKADVRTGFTVTSVSFAERSFRIEARHPDGPQSIEARTVIGAWGRSPDVRLADRRQRAFHHPYVGVKTHYEGIRMGQVVELYFFPGGYFGVSPIEGNRVNAAGLLTRQAFHRAGKRIADAVQAAACLNPAFARRLFSVRPVAGTEKAVSPVQISRRPFAWDRVAHIGDAAVTIPPLCGDGMAMALRSAELCANFADRHLRGKMALNEWRSKYARALQQEFARPLKWGNILQLLLGNTHMAPRLFRLGKWSPDLASRLVRLTRLKERAMD